MLGTYAGLVVFSVSIVLALAMALSFKTLHRRRRRRSPLQGRRIGKVPGQALVDRITDHDFELVGGIMLMFLAAPLMFGLWAGQRLDWSRVGWGVSELTALTGAFVLMGWGLRQYIHHFRLRDKARDGLLAERVTGMQLNRLTADGCTVLHDIQGDGFNIDHVVIAPRGVYMVETKSFRKPRDADSETSHKVVFDGTMLRFPDFATDAPIKQARRQAKWLQEFLRESLQRDIPVMATLALPGWWVDSVGRANGSDVRAFSPLKRGCVFMADPSNVLDVTSRALVAQAIALRYPEVGD